MGYGVLTLISPRAYPTLSLRRSPADRHRGVMRERRPVPILLAQRRTGHGQPERRAPRGADTSEGQQNFKASGDGLGYASPETREGLAGPSPHLTGVAPTAR